MREVAIIGLVALMSSIGLGQDVKESDVSAATRRYRAYRTQDTEPSYGLAKVKAAIKRTKPTKGDDMDSVVLAPSVWKGLSTAERFTYCMLHGEVASQNCDGMPWIVDEEHKLFAHPPAFHDAEEDWSDRQISFLKGRRQSIVRLLRETMARKEGVGVNLKNCITRIDAYELIPDLVRLYDRDHRDQDLLSVLAVLMKDGKDKPFLASTTYRKLYGSDANYQSFIVANPENQKLMTDRAMAYYRRRMG